MSLTVQDGKLVVRNGALGTGAACCCGGGGCTSKSCALVPDFVQGGFDPVGTCQLPCCCEGVPHGSCLDDSVTIDENGNPSELLFKSFCENCCENKLLFSCTFPIVNADGPARAQEWVENVRDHLLANGWGNATEYHFDCYSQGNQDPIAKSYVRVCCDGTLVCPATEEDCFAASLVALAPADTSNLQVILTPNCFVGTLECLPACEPNPLP